MVRFRILQAKKNKIIIIIIIIIIKKQQHNLRDIPAIFLCGLGNFDDVV